METYPALRISAVRGADIWRLDAEGEGVGDVPGLYDVLK
jgi:hypothetical protein